MRRTPNSARYCLSVAAPQSVHVDASQQPSTVVYMVRACSGLLWSIATAAQGLQCDHLSQRVLQLRSHPLVSFAAVQLSGSSAWSARSPAPCTSWKAPQGTHGHEVDCSFASSRVLTASVAFCRLFRCKWLCIS